MRPLSEIVSLVAAEVRTSSPAAPAESTVIPITIVAAFVDGDLTEEETRSVLQSIRFDNSIIAELIAAVLAKEESRASVPQIPDSLALRLMNMGTSSELMPPIMDVPQVRLSNDRDEQTPRLRGNARSLLVWGVGIVAATAAAWVATIYLLPQTNSTPSQNEIAVVPPSEIEQAPSPQSPLPGFVPESLESPVPDSPIMELVETPREHPIKPLTPVDLNPDTTNERVIPVENVVVMPETVMPEVKLSATPLSDLMWTRLTGLVAQERAERASPDYRVSEEWSAISESSRSFSNADEREALRLVTLPLSRAEASIAQGGRLVLASDSMIELRTDSGSGNDQANSSCVLDVEYGSVALTNVTSGTEIDLRSRGTHLAELRWDTEASIVIGHMPQGLTIQVHAGRLSVDDEPHEESSLVLSANGKPQLGGDAKRLPTWVDRPIDSLPISKVILAQLAESPNLLVDLSKQTNALASIPNKNPNEARALAALAMWQATLTGPNVARLLNRSEAEIRNAALQRLVETPTWEPRYTLMWNGAERLLQAPLITPQIQQMCEQLRRGAGLNAIQTELLLTGLGGPTVGRRAICDYLLRSNIGGGPPFDPTWTGPTQLRAIAQWRRVVNL